MDILSYKLGKASGGGGGTSDYSQLSNKPSINGITLDGNLTSSDLDVQSTIVLGTTGDFNTSAKALRIDLLEENEVYVVINNNISGQGSMYVAWDDNGTILTKEIGGIRSVSYTPTLYFEYRKNPAAGSTDYLVYMWREFWYFTGGYNSIYRYITKFYVEDDTLKSEEYSEIGCDIVNTDGSQTISAKKTFSVLPESSVTPTGNNQLVNKKYVDDSIASAITDALGGSY